MNRLGKMPSLFLCGGQSRHWLSRPLSRGFALSPASRPPCPHDIGPGTSVCLRCRQEQRELARARQRRALARVGVILGGLIVVAVISNAAVSSLRTPDSKRGKEPLQLLASTSTSTVRQQGAPVAPPRADTPAPTTAPAVPKSKPTPGLTLKVPEG